LGTFLGGIPPPVWKKKTLPMWSYDGSWQFLKDPYFLKFTCFFNKTAPLPDRKLCHKNLKGGVRFSGFIVTLCFQNAIPLFYLKAEQEKTFLFSDYSFILSLFVFYSDPTLFHLLFFLT